MGEGREYLVEKGDDTTNNGISHELLALIGIIYRPCSLCVTCSNVLHRCGGWTRERGRSEAIHES